MAILLVDNYDSFTYNLAHLFGELGGEVVVLPKRRARRGRGGAARADAPRRLPRSGAACGCRRDDRRSSDGSHRTRRTLGVCLGHQAIVEAFGGEIGRPSELVHGKAARVKHDGRGIFAGLPDGFEAGRYHSLAATTVPDELEVSATTADGEVMARAAPGAARRRRAVPPRVGADAARAGARARTSSRAR